MRRTIVTLLVVVVSVGVFLLLEKPALSFTEDERIEILVGYSPGGGHDIEARMISRWIGKYLPGEPDKVIVKNMPGAGGLIQGAHLYARARRDGLTWAIVGTTHWSSQVLAAPAPQYNLLQMPQVFATGGSGATIMRDFLGVQKPEELTKIDPAKIVVSGRTITGASFLTDVLGLELLGIDGYRYVVGYPGTAQMAAAFFRGEISYVGGTGLHHALGKGGRYYEAIQERKAVLLWQTGVLKPDGSVVRSPGTDVPTIAEVYERIHGKDPSGPLWEAYKLTGPGVRTLNRSLSLPPGVPHDRVNTLREAFDKLYADPEFISEWERIFGLKLDYTPGAEADRVGKLLLSPSPGWDFIKNDFLPRLRGRKG